MYNFFLFFGHDMYKKQKVVDNHLVFSDLAQINWGKTFSVVLSVVSSVKLIMPS